LDKLVDGTTSANDDDGKREGSDVDSDGHLNEVAGNGQSKDDKVTRVLERSFEAHI
jgi:hypothetical protein